MKQETIFGKTSLSWISLVTLTSLFTSACVSSGVSMEEAAIHGAADQQKEVEVIDPDTRGAMGVYLTASSAADEDFFEGTLTELQDITHPAFVIDVKGSYVYFDADAPLAKEIGTIRPLVDLAGIVEQAHASGVTVIARFIAAKDPSLSQLVPKVQIHHPETNVSAGNTWVDLLHPTTLEYNREILREVAKAGVDEINLDYIRYPTEYSQASIGLTGEEKAERIGTFIVMARQVIDEVNPDIELGISTYAILGWNFPINFEPLGQDIGAFGEIVDIVSPMAYPATFAVGYYYRPGVDPVSRMYYLVYRTLEGYKELLGPNAYKLRPWIQGYNTDTQDMIDQMNAVFDSGACGFTVWSAGNYYSHTYPAMRKFTEKQPCVKPGELLPERSGSGQTRGNDAPLG